MRAYYNDNEPSACEWLKELISAGCITPGDVDGRPIQEVRATNLAGYNRVHFFGGIAGWDHALNLANWGDRFVWTGSCPCQPFSSAGKQKGIADKRHLWPEMRRLISECRPATIFGEQVASKLGREWLAGVFVDLEALGYAVAGADLCAAGVGAPHVRQRLFWVANAGCSVRGTGPAAGHETEGRELLPDERPQGATETASCSVALGVEYPESDGWRERRTESGGRSIAGGCGWSDFDFIACRDGKTRRVEPGTLPLAHGVPGRVGLLRGYGNAIVPAVAAAFIKAFLDAEREGGGSNG